MPERRGPAAGNDSILKAIVFDFDGVILESAAIKTGAMAELFADRPDRLDDIVALHEAHAGLSRFVKFDMIYRDILKAPLTPERREDLGARFSALVLEKVLACPFVPGALNFLKARHRATPLYVVSGTPDAELSKIVSARGLSRYFRETYGSDRQKNELLGQILVEIACRVGEIVFIGDAMSDYHAAKETGVPFIGRVPENQPSPFPASTPMVPDLIGLERVLQERFTVPPPV